MRLNGGDDLLKIADSTSYLAPISEIDRARKYPYHAPSGGFILSNGDLFHLDESQSAMIAKMVFWRDGRRFYRLGQIGRRCNCFVNLAWLPLFR